MSETLKVEVIRSNRKTMSIQVKKTGQVIVRAPLWMKNSDIDRLICKKERWIRKHLEVFEQQKENPENQIRISAKEIETLVHKAKIVLPEKVAYYAEKIGVTYGRITIRNQKTRWGSCSSKGNLNFNCLLMKAPEKVQDYVVVHELCHRKQMNHSKDFWAEVEKILPEYKKQEEWLKVQGSKLI